MNGASRIANLHAEDGRVGERLRYNEAQESQHGDAPVPSLRPRRERAEAAGVRRLAAHDGHHGGVREQLHHSQEVEETRLAGICHLLKHRLPCQPLHNHCPHEPQHCQTAVDGLGCGSIKRKHAEEGLVTRLRPPLDLGTWVEGP